MVFLFFFIPLFSRQCKSVSDIITVVSHHCVPPTGQFSDPLFPEMRRAGVEKVGDNLT